MPIPILSPCSLKYLQLNQQRFGDEKVMGWWENTKNQLNWTVKYVILVYAVKQLGVAQLGSALEWGSRGRRFKSSHPDQKKTPKSRLSVRIGGFLAYTQYG
jgi:hypothetical protein